MVSEHSERLESEGPAEHPLVVIDCYEHAFYLDYRNKKGDYVAAYPKFIDWTEVEKRIRALK